MEMLCHYGGWCVTLKRQSACDHFKQDDAKRVDVAALIACLPPHLLGGNVERRSGLSSRQCGWGGSQKLGKTKIRENGFPHRIMSGVALVEENISGFEVAMDHMLLVSIINSEADGCEELHQLGR